MVRAHLPKHRGAVHTGSFQSHNKPQDSYLVYLKPYLPKKSNLANYGSNFASYIQSIKELKHLKYLSSVARLDYCMDNVYNSNETYKIEIREDNIGYFDDFKIKNYIRLFKSKHPIDFIYKFCNSKKQQIMPIELPKKDNKLLIFKQNHIVKYIKLDDFEYDFLFNFKKYKKLSNIQHKYDLEDDIKVQKILSKILRLKLLTY